jgi:hypothetical protein
MTEPRQDSPSDPEVSRLYRQHSTDEPSSAVDQRILAAARAALAGRPTNARGGWWQRWRTPLALATTLLLTVTLSVLHERQPAELPVERGLRQSLPPASGTAEEATSAPAPAAARPATAAGPARLPAEGRAQMPPPAARKTERDAPVTADNAATGGRPAAAESKAVPAATTLERAPSAIASPAAPVPAAPGAAASDARERFESAPAAAPPAAAKSRAEGVRTPASWLEEIRALRRAGRTDEAERQLREFRRLHPDYPLPEEFRQ